MRIVHRWIEFSLAHVFVSLIMPDDNPYAAPAMPEPITEPAKGRPWVPRKTDIICFAETLHLPPLCIATGRREDLVLQKATLATLRPSTSVGGFLTGLCLVVLMEYVGAGELVFAVIAAGLFLFAGASIFAKRFAKTPLRHLFLFVDAKWYLSRKYISSNKRLMWIVRFLGSFVVSGMVYALQERTPMLNRLSLSTTSGIGAFVLLLLVRGEAGLRLRGGEWIGAYFGRPIVDGPARDFFKQLDGWIREQAWQADEN